VAKPGLTVSVRIDGVRETLQAFRSLPKAANDSLRKRSMELAQTLADRVAAAGRADSRQSALVAPTVRARRDRVPVIVAGGPKRVGRNRKPAHKILFGAEFGAKTLPQFRPHLGRGSYWFFRTVEENQAETARAWDQVADDILRAYTRGGGH
jgi:hypothetical protein